jgi:serine/threonine protein kinase
MCTCVSPRINIGDFDVKRIIGRGNFADVKLAREKSSGNVYALKVMKKGGENVSAFYEEERDIMARAHSPWLTKLDYAFQVPLLPV